MVEPKAKDKINDKIFLINWKTSLTSQKRKGIKTSVEKDVFVNC